MTLRAPVTIHAVDAGHPSEMALIVILTDTVSGAIAHRAHEAQGLTGRKIAVGVTGTVVKFSAQLQYATLCDDVRHVP